MINEHYSVTENNGDGSYDCKDCGQSHPMDMIECPVTAMTLVSLCDAIWQLDAESMPVSERTEKYTKDQEAQ